MCGLIGIIIGKKYTNKEMESVKKVFTNLLIGHEERGKEATGVAAISHNAEYYLSKSPVRATEFVKTKEYSDFLDIIRMKTGVILGHTRKPTKGSHWNPKNNHPIVYGSTLGVHNGTIKNDDFLFKYEGLTRNAEVDSEIIFSILNKALYKKKNKKFILDVQRSVRKFAGSFTTISINLEYPSKVLILRYNQPLSYHYSSSLKTLFFASRYIFLRKIFGRSVVAESLSEKTGFLFDLSSKSVKAGGPLLEFPIQSGEDYLKMLMNNKNGVDV